MSAFEMISNSPVILDNIFMSMELFELYKARRVCKFWKTVADDEIRRRRRTPKVDCITVSFRVKNNRGVSDTLKILRDHYNVWKRSWVCTPTTLLISPSMTCDFDYLPIPADCVGVVVDGAPVCVDGIHIETEDVDGRKFECCNLVAFHSLDLVSVLASQPGDEKGNFFEELEYKFADASLKFCIIFVHHVDGLSLFLKTFHTVMNIASKKGVVVLCYSSMLFPKVMNYRGHEALNCAIVAVCFNGQNTSAASLFRSGGAWGGVKGLVEDYKTLNSARRGFAVSCPQHEMNRTGFCRKCKSQTLGLLLAPPHYFPNYGFDAEENDPRPLCYNQQQDAFRFVIPNVPLIGWLNDTFMLGCSINVDEECGVSWSVLPRHDVNFVCALLVLR